MKNEGLHDWRNSSVADYRLSNKMVNDESSIRMVNSYVHFIHTGNLELSGGRQRTLLALCPRETHTGKTGTNV